MKKYLLLAAVLAAVISAPASAAYKTPSLTGGTGMVRMPTGDVLNSNDFNIGLDYCFDNSTGTTSYPNDIRGTWSYKANFGSYLGIAKGMELGFVGRSDRTTGRFREGVFINMKYSLSSSDDPDALHLAIGVENLTSASQTDVYMAASKYFRGGAGLHFGAMFDFPENRFRPLGMLGLSVPVGSPNLSIMAEVFGGETMFQGNAGLRYVFNRNISIIGRALNLTNSESSKDPNCYSAGISLSNFF